MLLRNAALDVADNWPIQRWLSRAGASPGEDTSKGGDIGAQVGGWLRDSLHSADKLARNQVLHCPIPYL